MMPLLHSPGAHPVYIIVENVRSLFNVGALFRSADGVCASGVYLTGFTGQPPRREISRVALGAEENVPWHYERDTLAVIAMLRRNGIQVVALEQTPLSVDYTAFSYRLPVAVVVGHEVDGVRPETVAACDGAVQLPMRGQKASLNVSVAGGIMLYHLLRVAESDGRRCDGAPGSA